MNKIIKIDADTVTIAKADGTFAIAPRTSLSFEPSLNDVVDLYQVGDDMIVNQAAASSPVQPAEAVSGFQQEPAPTVEDQQEQVVNPGAGQQAQFAQSQEAYQAQGQFQQSDQAGNFQQGSSQSYNQVQGKKKKTAALWALLSMGAYFIYRGDTLLGLLILIPELVSSFFISGISGVGLILLIVVNLAASILGYFVVMSSEAGSFLHQDAQGREMLD